jgi:uncharacterized glyoxalase superfamily protein PhnB
VGHRRHVRARGRAVHVAPVTSAGYRSRMAAAADARPAAILKSSDIHRTEDWYRNVGFVLRGHHPEEAPIWCELERDGTVLQFLSGETPWSDAPSFTGCFYVHCSDVDAVYEQIRDLVEIESGVEDREWGARELVLRDPDGYFLTFTQPA